MSYLLPNKKSVGYQKMKNKRYVSKRAPWFCTNLSSVMLPEFYSNRDKKKDASNSVWLISNLILMNIKLKRRRVYGLIDSLTSTLLDESNAICNHNIRPISSQPDRWLGLGMFNRSIGHKSKI